MMLRLMDLTIGEYQEYCDVCERPEEECNEVLYEFSIMPLEEEDNESAYHLCEDCLEKMKRLLSRPNGFKSHSTLTAQL